MERADLRTLEQALHRTLNDWREVDGWNDDWIEPANNWAREISRRAGLQAPLDIVPSVLAKGLEIAKCPVIICGMPRSGTTLVRDLLDDHPALCVLPSEGQYFNRPQVSDEPVAERDIALDWLPRLANPNHQRPFWVLGRAISPDNLYVSFVRSLHAWESALASAGFRDAAIAAVSLAIATTQGQDLSEKRLWVDKTPGAEFHLDRVRRHFPDSKIIYLTRDPREVSSSYIAGVERNKLAGVPVDALLRGFIRSHLAGIRAKYSTRRSNFLIVSYDELVRDRKQAMLRVADFLGIEFNECLLRQTIAGRAAEPNSSFSGGTRGGFAADGAWPRFWLHIANVVRWILLFDFVPSFSRLEPA